MKTVILLLIIIGYCVQSKAQVITNDKNWNTTPVFIDDFNPPRSAWDSNWLDNPNDNKWYSRLSTGVTHGHSEHMVYQRGNTLFNSSDSTMRLRAEYVGGPLNCGDYEIPPSPFVCDSLLDSLHYHSGALITKDPFKYGYFEARCKLPVNQGAFPAFWLSGSAGGNYSEIDIFEHSWDQGGIYGSSRLFSGSIWYWTNVKNETNYGLHYYNIPASDSNLTYWHTYGLEWSPRRVVFYCDNKNIGTFSGDSLPACNMYLMLNYALDNWVFNYYGPITSDFPNDMTIDYVKVYKLKTGGCSTDALIQNNSQLSSFDYRVKKSINAGGYGNDITISSNSKVVLRATDGITINGNFEVQAGSELELITHPCPE